VWVGAQIGKKNLNLLSQSHALSGQKAVMFITDAAGFDAASLTTTRP
jgi:hypothetical protein